MSDYPIKSPRKLIEVSMPLTFINTESLRRKQKAPKGWPTSFHKWWAQRPLAAARAVIFGQLVNDPSWQWELEQPGKIPPNNLKASWAKSRKRLFAILEELVLWDNSNNQEVLQKARVEMLRSWREVCELNRGHPQATTLFNPEKLPALHDPFAGSGTIPLEAQRLGLDARASDLNPVAVIINKALIEYPRRFAGRAPVGPTVEETKQGAKLGFSQSWPNAAGLAEDVRRYGEWMRKEAQKRIGHLYPPIEITAKMANDRPDLKPLVGQKLTIIAWIWARTVKSPNPAFSHVNVPLASSFVLSSKDGKQSYVVPTIAGDKYSFTVKRGVPPPEAEAGTSSGKRKAFRCIISNAPIDYDHIREEGKAGRMGQKLMAMVAEGQRGRVYLSPTAEMEAITAQAEPKWIPDLALPNNPRDFKPPNYGITTYGALFTPRQLLGLTTFSDLVLEARERVLKDALKAGMPDDGRGLNASGNGATAYAEALTVYLACVLDRMIYYGTSLTTWLPKDSALRDCMPRQALAMTWDFAECNPLGKSSGDITTCMNSVSNYLDIAAPYADVIVGQQDAATSNQADETVLVSTDPPYYDNIGYADLSDFFYIWLRRSLRPIYPDIFATVAVPKAEELVATPYRHGSKEKAESFFLHGMTEAMTALAAKAHPAMPITIYYAFKQAETEADEGTSSTGWETFLAAVLRAGLLISGTWPLRTEGAGRMMAKENNALASSIVLVCRKRPADAPSISRREFLRELSSVLPEALDEMTKGAGGELAPIAPVDLSQAIIGPGMAVFSKYTAVLEADGSPMSVRTALQLINRFLAEDDFDADTQFCLHWFEQHGWGTGESGDADGLARAKNTSENGLVSTGVIFWKGGKTRLLKWAEYPTDWDPRTDARTPVWEALHQLIRALKQGGESASGALLAALGGKAEAVRQLAYRLYTLCERLGQAEDARAYNELITSWTGIESAASTAPKPTDGFLPGLED
jgi:putative DNA methylase